MVAREEAMKSLEKAQGKTSESKCEVTAEKEWIG